MKPKILFILKLRNSGEDLYGYGGGVSSGLLNSARFVTDFLEKEGFPVELFRSWTATLSTEKSIAAALSLLLSKPCG
jgi:hypothetical protein